jgi:hypothetical protein
VPTKSRTKPTPLEAFEDNMSDARHLVRRVECFTNRRTTRMRKELRERVGNALKVAKRDWPSLDCLESDDVFVTFKPGSSLSREDFLDHAPLLRQALVAGCAAFETYMADEVMARIGPYLSSGQLTERMCKIPLDLGTWMHIHHAYNHKKRGLRKNVIEPYVMENASTAPNKVGELLVLLGIKDWPRKLDAARGVERGTTQADLERITARRNRIAHSGDRDGRGRAHISLDYVRRELDCLESIVKAVGAVADAHVA